MPDLSFREVTSNADLAAAAEFYAANYIQDPPGDDLGLPGCPSLLAEQSVALTSNPKTRWVVGYDGEQIVAAIPVWLHPIEGVHLQVLGWATHPDYSDEGSYRQAITGLAQSLPWPGCCDNLTRFYAIEHQYMPVLEEVFDDTLIVSPFTVAFVTMPDAHPLVQIDFNVPREMTA